jgi:hypothetical protein
MESITITKQNATGAIIEDLAVMLMALREEMEPGKINLFSEDFIAYIMAKIENGSHIVYIKDHGFTIADFVTDKLMKPEFQEQVLWAHVYVKPDKRKSRAYALLLKSILDLGKPVIGFMFKDSTHNEIISKRFKTLGVVYGT